MKVFRLLCVIIGFLVILYGGIKAWLYRGDKDMQKRQAYPMMLVGVGLVIVGLVFFTLATP